MNLFFKEFVVVAHNPTSRRLTHGVSYTVKAVMDSPHYLVIDDMGELKPYNINQFI